MAAAKPWESIASVRAALGSENSISKLWKTFDAEAHAELLLELSYGERAVLLRAPSRYSGPRRDFVGAVERLAFEYATGGRPREALKLFDALLPAQGLALSTYCNALWVVQDDNTHLGVDEPRARRYLDFCLPHGPDNPAVFFNACCVLSELGDLEGALARLRDATMHGFSRDVMREQIQSQPLFAALRSDGRCFGVLESPGPQGAGLVELVVDKVRREGWAALRLGQPGEGPAYGRSFSPLPAEVLATLTLPNGAPLPPSLRTWLAFDAAWLASLGWFSLEPRFTWTPRTLGEIAAAEYGSADDGEESGEGEVDGEDDEDRDPDSAEFEVDWGKEFDVPSLAQGFLLPGGSDSRRVYMLSSSPDPQGDYPVLFTDIDEHPAVGIMYPGFDVWLAAQARVLSVCEPDYSSYTDAFEDARFAARCRHHAEAMLGGKKEVEFPGRQKEQPVPGALSVTEHPPLVRTDFTDDAAWGALRDAIGDAVGEFRANVTPVSERTFDGATLARVVELAGAAGHSFAFVADGEALRNPEHPVLVVDLADEVGRSFRVIPSEAWSVENNLSLANMDFDEFLAAAGDDGVFRGFR
jgi:hypothetical protein